MSLSKQLPDHFTDISEHLQIAFSYDAVTRTLVLFALAVAFGMPRDPIPKLGQRHSGRSAEPVEPLDGEGLTIKFEPENASAELAQHLYADINLADFGAPKTRLQLHMPDDPVRLQHQVVPAAVDLAFQHLDVTSALPSHERKQLPKEDVAQRLLAKAGIG